MFFLHDSHHLVSTTAMISSTAASLVHLFSHLGLKSPVPYKTSFYLNKKMFYKALGSQLLVVNESSLTTKKVFFIELELVGLGYRVSVKRGRVRLSLGFSHVIVSVIPKSVFILKKRYRILLYSINKFALNSFVSMLLKFKKLNPYKVKGLKKRHVVYKLKPGKRSK